MKMRQAVRDIDSFPEFYTQRHSVRLALKSLGGAGRFEYRGILSLSLNVCGRL